MNYAEISDFEINKSVGEIILKGKWACKPGHSGNESDSWYYGSVDTFVTPYHQLPDYCNSWSDAGPIIEKERITIAFDGSEWVADSDAYFVDGTEWQISGETNRNPLRAAMIVFLMMQEEK